MWFRVLGLLVFCVSLVTVSGCRNKTLDELIREATAGRTGCTENEVEVLEQDVRRSGDFWGTGTWTARCDGQVYVCSSSGSVTCTRRIASAPAPEEEREARSSQPPPRRHISLIEGRDAQGRPAYRAHYRAAEAEMKLTVGPGSLDQVNIELISPRGVPFRNCENLVFSNGETTLEQPLQELNATFDYAALMPLLTEARTQIHFCGIRTILEPRQAQTFSRFQDLVDGIPAQSSEQTSGGEAPSAPDAATTVREALTAQAAMLRTCADSEEPLRVEAEWNAAGEVRLAITRAEEAVNACINQAITINVQEGEPGSLLHLVAP